MTKRAVASGAHDLRAENRESVRLFFLELMAPLGLGLLIAQMRRRLANHTAQRTQDRSPSRSPLRTRLSNRRCAVANKPWIFCGGRALLPAVDGALWYARNGTGHARVLLSRCLGHCKGVSKSHDQSSIVSGIGYTRGEAQAPGQRLVRGERLDRRMRRLGHD